MLYQPKGLTVLKQINMANLLYSVREVFSNYLKDCKHYRIPPYQRGYKWEAHDVSRLLDDIKEFDPGDDADKFYCLQNITLVEKDGNYNVVDGQQRLTTLAVILSYVGQYDLINGKLIYSIRKETEEFLEKYIYQPSDITVFTDWDDFLAKAKVSGVDYDYQDIYYLFQAYQTVVKWFEKNDNFKGVILTRLLDHVKLIVNLVRNIDEQELFENLNGKRVPLDGADLVRALIITRIARQEIPNTEDDIKYNVLINERRTRIGITLDDIGRWWTDSNRQTWFGFFTRKVKTDADETVNFDEVQHQINYLYELYAQVYNDGVVSVSFYEKEVAKKGFLQRLLDFQRTMQNWYDEPVLYHLVPYAHIHAGMKLKDIYDTWRKFSRQEFITTLKKNIRKSSAIEALLGEEGKDEQSTSQNDWFNDDLASVCILLDTIHCLNNQTEMRLPARYFQWVRKEEDREHIFPQTPIADKVKEPDKQTDVLMTYVDLINDILKDNKREDECIDKKKLFSSINWYDDEWRQQTEELVNEYLAKLIPVNNLGNMCLLNSSVNRGYGNDFFLEKRIDVMRKSQEGNYIRPHVYDAFNKVFKKREEKIDMEQMTKWGKEDILQRCDFIIKQIKKFLSNGDTTE